MISLISRNYGKSKDVLLSIRVKSSYINTAFALGISVSPQRWSLINDTIKEARKAYRRGTSIFIDDNLTSSLWSLMKKLMIQDKANTISKASIENTIRDILHADEKEAIDEAAKAKRDELLNVLSPKREKPTFKAWFDQYIHDLASGARLRHRSTTKVAESTVKNYESIRANIRRYEREKHLVIDWEDINIDFFMKFKAFLADEGLKPNTIATYLQKFRTLLRNAKLLHLTVNDDFNVDSWYSEGEDVDNIYLTTERIMELYNAKLDNWAWLSKKIAKLPESAQKTQYKWYYKIEKHRRWLCQARDIYVVGCLTGQRYSDYIRINEQMYVEINDKRFIHLWQDKTGKEVYIPLVSQVEEILKRNDGKLPLIQRAKLCYTMRVVGLFLGWTEDVQISESKGSMSYNKTAPFYKLLKSHTCRRSFATNAYRANVPLSAIMAVTGHSSEDMLRRYLKLNNKERALFAAEELSKMHIG